MLFELIVDVVLFVLVSLILFVHILIIETFDDLLKIYNSYQ